MPLKNIRQAMGEFKRGSLHSGPNGPVVTDRKQAIAIALNSERRKKKAKAGDQRRGIAAARP